MSTFDLVVAAVVPLAMIGGARLGVRMPFPWVGLGVGAAVGAALVHHLLASTRQGGSGWRLLATVAGICALGLAGMALGSAVGARAPRPLEDGVRRALDGAAGAGAGFLSVLVLVWVLLPTLAEVPGWTARSVRTSLLARALDARAGGPPSPLRALPQLVAGTSSPLVFAKLRPAPETGFPPAGSSMPIEVEQQARAAAVMVTATGCRHGVEGSGVALAPNLVVTIAHLVAGQRSLRVRTFDGRVLPAVVTRFDPAADLAVLRVEGLGAPALPVGDVGVGSRVAVMAYEHGHPVTVHGRVDRQLTADGTDIYRRRRARREVLVLSARLARRHTGAAVVDASGQVVGAVFAFDPAQRNASYAAVGAALSRAVAGDSVRPVDTGPCLPGS